MPLAAFGPKATELAQYKVGQVVTLGGFIRPNEHGLELVVMRHELVATRAVEEIAPELAAEIQPAAVAEAQPKAKGRGRKKPAA